MKGVRRVLIILSVIIFVYIAGVLFFTGRFQFRTYVNGDSVFYKTPGDVAYEYMQDTADKILTISLDGKELETISYLDLGVYSQEQVDFRQTELNSFAWPLSIFVRTDYTLDSDYSFLKETLYDQMEQLAEREGLVIWPKEVNVKRQDDGRYQVVLLSEESTADILVDTVKQAVADGKEKIDLRGIDAYVNPENAGSDGYLEDYIEIDIGSQTMKFFVDGMVYTETPVVTGMADDETRQTPTGIWMSHGLKRNIIMTGDYGELPCQYFIQVNDEGVGIHDASWRSEFGGEIYKTDGSHGCINTPYDAEKLIFEKMESMGRSIPIIIH